MKKEETAANKLTGLSVQRPNYITKNGVELPTKHVLKCRGDDSKTFEFGKNLGANLPRTKEAIKLKDMRI